MKNVESFLRYAQQSEEKQKEMIEKLIEMFKWEFTFK